MRRSTAAAVGTLTGAALIVGVRLSVATPDVTAAPPAVDLAGKGGAADASPSTKPTKKPPANADDEEGASAADDPEVADSGLKDGTYQGEGAKNPYGTIQVSIKVTGGKIVAADASYPTSNNSATINPPAIAKLKEATLEAQSAEVDAVSGATFTSESYVKSLQAALDEAGA